MRTTHVWNKLLLIQYRGRNQTRNQSDETKQAVYWTITACIKTLCLVSSSCAEPSWVQVWLFTADWDSGQTDRPPQDGAEASGDETFHKNHVNDWRSGFISPHHHWQLQNQSNRPYYTGNGHHNTINKYWYVYTLYILLLHKIKFYITSAADFK